MNLVTGRFLLLDVEMSGAYLFRVWHCTVNSVPTYTNIQLRFCWFVLIFILMWRLSVHGGVKLNFTKILPQMSSVGLSTDQTASSTLVGL